jgi:hypothetical protein
MRQVALVIRALGFCAMARFISELLRAKTVVYQVMCREGKVREARARFARHGQSQNALWRYSPLSLGLIYLSKMCTSSLSLQSTSVSNFTLLGYPKQALLHE